MRRSMVVYVCENECSGGCSGGCRMSVDGSWLVLGCFQTKLLPGLQRRDVVKLKIWMWYD